MTAASARYSHHLLDLDAELAGELDLGARAAARLAATAVSFWLEPQIDCSRARAAAVGGPGLLVLSGALVGHARLLDRVVAELLGQGDLIQPEGDEERGEFIRCDVSWRALQPVRFAILDAEFAERIRPWPQITHALLGRVKRRVENLAVQRAIAAQPRLEVRLLLLLWHLGARWGKVRPGGIRLAVPLTHLLLGQLVGAERPSVTHALGRLGAAGAVSGAQHGWHLRGCLAEHLSAIGAGEALGHIPRSVPTRHA